MSRLPLRQDCLDVDDENAPIARTQGKTSVKALASKMVSFRTPLTDVKNRMENGNVQPSETTQQQSAVKSKERNQDPYYDPYKKAQLRILQLQEVNRQFEGLMPAIETTFQLQGRMKDAISEAARKIVSTSTNKFPVVNNLKEEIAFLQHQHSKCQDELDASNLEKREMAADIKVMESLLKQSSSNMRELDENWHSMHQEMKRSRDHIRDLELDKASVKRTFNIMVTEKVKAEEELSECKSKMEKERTTFSDTRTKMEQYIENLQYTLDSWEVDRETAEQEIDSLRQKVVTQQTAMKEMAAELTIYKKKTEERINFEAEINELKSQKQFMEAEKDLFTTAITDYRLKLEAEEELVKSNQSLISALKSSNDELQCSNDELQCSHEELQMELHNVKKAANEKASVMMATFEQIQHCVLNTLVSLQHTFGVKLSCEAMIRPRAFTSQQQRAPQPNRRSFVGEILSLASRQDLLRTARHRTPSSSSKSTPQSCLKESTRHPRQDNVEFRSSVKKSVNRVDMVTHRRSLSVGDGQAAGWTSRRCLRFNPSECLEKSHGESMDSPHSSVSGDLGFHLLQSIDMDMDKPASSLGFAMLQHRPSPADKNHGADLEWLHYDIEKSEHVDSITSMLASIKTTGQAFERASRLSIADLKGEIEILHEKLSLKGQTINELTRDLRTRMDEVEGAREEMETLNQRVRSMTEAILKHEDLSYDIERFEEEKEDWRLRERRLTGEIKLLSQQLEELVGKADTAHGQAKDGACLREIVALKKKNYQLECQIYESMQMRKQIESKNARRVRITRENWEKAEAEVKDLDIIIQRIRKVCMEARHSQPSPALLNIIRLIDGQVDSIMSDNATTPSPNSRPSGGNF